MRNIVRFAMLLLFAMMPMAHDAYAKQEEKKPAPPQDVMKIISEHKELSKFADYINDTGLEKFLEDKDKTFTVLAPVNDAFGKISSEVAKKIKEDKKNLQSLVKHHIITGSLIFSSNMRGRKAGVATASSEGIIIDGTGKTTKINDAEFVKTDLVAGNGVVHIVSAVLEPPSYKEIKPSKEEMEKEMENRRKEMEERMKKEHPDMPLPQRRSPAPDSEQPAVEQPTTEQPAAVQPELQIPDNQPPFGRLPTKQQPKEDKGISGWFKKLFKK